MDATDRTVIGLLIGGDLVLLALYLWALWSDRSEQRQDELLSWQRQEWHATLPRPAEPGITTRRLPRGSARVIEMEETP